MSRASDTFSQSILDAENLLKHFNTLNRKPPPPEIEVLDMTDVMRVAGQIEQAILS
jgi:hypothetical protein